MPTLSKLPEHDDYVTQTECRAIVNDVIDQRVEDLRTRTKGRIQKAMEATPIGAVAYKYTGVVADKVVQAGGWVAAGLLLIIT